MRQPTPVGSLQQATHAPVQLLLERSDALPGVLQQAAQLIHVRLQAGALGLELVPLSADLGQVRPYRVQLTLGCRRHDGRRQGRHWDMGDG